MRTVDLVSTAVANTFRSKTRTILTVLAIFVGAFTLTITNGLGTGINAFIDSTVSSMGASDVLTVTKTTAATSTGPQKYDPDAVASAQQTGGRPGGAGEVTALTDQDIADISAIAGVEKVVPVTSVSIDYVEAAGGDPYVAQVGSLVAGQTPQIADGAAPDDGSDALQVALPSALVTPLGFADAADAVGATVTIAVTDPVRTQHLVEATVSGVTEDAFGGTTSLTTNSALEKTLFTLQNTGVPADQLDRYASASATVSSSATPAEIDQVKAALTDAGYTGTTVEDQLGTFESVINGIVLVLNAFAIIALLAASFGIVNTLLMSVQERTREIGLMKAMGMGSGRVFSLFSLEAIFIGFLGSALGAVIAIGVGTAVSAQLAASLFSDLPGLQLIAFDPVSILVTTLAVMGIAFLAGTLPAARAARADPVESLRYE
ncbi:ABC-type antimicrobial peptide transport system, permease component [Microbacterium testaceum StLB037]|uniref:ABC-type antimicrobial peptide transport system, permease component n=1 Tax=Microbacterium testaceum (strain StLB037) TaxID=979556 RepID=E8N8W1_MICTS|nr:ABC transporter permease [Microbacterium testaceum]BAJ73170.1 ABC-type antimicrobial peptide transport system, permease component [Microbacterium testaceum StLB037]